MLEEETQHFPRCVRSSRISIGARRAASRPCMSSSVDVPVLKDSAPTRVGMDRAGIGMPSRYPPAMHVLLGACRSHRLLKNMIAVVWMHRNVAIAVKNNGRDRCPRHLELACHRTRHLVAWRQMQREGQWRPHRRGQNVHRLPRINRCTLLP